MKYKCPRCGCDKQPFTNTYSIPTQGAIENILIRLDWTRCNHFTDRVNVSPWMCEDCFVYILGRIISVIGKEKKDAQERCSVAGE